MEQIRKIVVAVAVAGVAVLGSAGTANASTMPADGHRDVHGDHDGHTDNDHNGHGHRGWIHYRNYGWYAGAVTVRQCFQGGGHVNRDRDECAGGRFNGDLVR